MSCAIMGGPCDEMIMAETKEEMMQKGMEHVKTAHPEMVAAIDAMSPEEIAAWQEKFDKAWEEAEVVTDGGPATPKEEEEEKEIAMM